MKIETQKEQFIPKSITLTFESMEEVEVFYAIFNHTYLVNLFPGSVKSYLIRDNLKNLYPNIDYIPTHVKIQDLLK